MVQEREEQRKRNVDRQRAYREIKLKQLEEARNQFVEQQKNLNVIREILRFKMSLIRDIIKYYELGILWGMCVYNSSLTL